MIILAVDTTEATASVALTKDYSLIAEIKFNSSNTHSETLLPMIDELLKKAKMTVSDIDLVGLAIGPGSFTGLRIGAATIKGLVLPFNTPCVGVSSLYAMARQLSCFKGVICSVINARRGQYYTAIYTSNGNGTLKTKKEDSILLVDDIKKELDGIKKKIYFVGSGTDELHDIIPSELTPEPMKYESAYYVAVSAYDKYLSASDEEKKLFTAGLLNPIYLRKAQAERELEEKRKKNENK